MDDMTTAIAGLQGDNVGCISSLFYANNSGIRSLDCEWLHNVNQYLCNLFRDYNGLKSNTEKTETMSCHPGAIQEWFSMEGYKHQHKGTEETYNKRKGKRTVCPLPACGKDLTLVFLQSQLCMQHWIDASGSIITEPEVLAPCLYKLRYIQHLGHSWQKVPCPVEDWRYSASTAAYLQQHFFNCHHTYRLHVEEESSVPSYCRACGILVSLHSL